MGFQGKQVLLTTPDYPPKIGGLSTYTLNIEKALKSQGIFYELFVWKNIRDVRRILKRYDLIINVHYMGGYFTRELADKHINFFHGSEILFYSPIFFKRWVKRFLKNKMIAYMEDSYLNMFISEFTFEKLKEFGFSPDYSRDLIIHNGIDLAYKPSFVKKNLYSSELRLVCVARDVPHKNISGAVKFAEMFAKESGKRVILYTTCEKQRSSEEIEIHNLDNMSDSSREEIYKDAHFNLLLSMDHSHLGFFEGFGLTCLEAARYGTPSIVLKSGGLPENIHHGFNGYVLSSIDENSIRKLWDEISQDDYELISKNSYDHVMESHSLEIYKKVFERVFDKI